MGTFLVPSPSWPLCLYDLLCTGSWDATSGLCNCCGSPIPGCHPHPSSQVLRKAPLVPTARCPPRALSSPPCPTTGLSLRQLTVSSTEPALGSQDSLRDRCHTGARLCCSLCHSLSKKTNHAFSTLRQLQICNFKMDFEGHWALPPPYSEFSARLMSLMLLCRGHPDLKQVGLVQRVLNQSCLTEGPNSTVNCGSFVCLCSNQCKPALFTYLKRSLRNASTLHWGTKIASQG